MSPADKSRIFKERLPSSVGERNGFLELNVLRKQFANFDLFALENSQSSYSNHVSKERLGVNKCQHTVLHPLPE